MTAAAETEASWTTHAAALAFLDAGCSVLRVRPDGSKAPVGFWETAQRTAASRETIDGWFLGGHPGIGVVTGAVSGNLEMLEFEGRAVAEDLHGQLQELADASGLGELWQRVATGYREVTPSGGQHLLFRVHGTPVLSNTKLARRPSTPAELRDHKIRETAVAQQQHADDPDKLQQRLQKIAALTPEKVTQVLIETRGEGGFVVVAPSNGPIHSNGKAWTLDCGGPDSIPTISAQEYAALHHLARAFDALPLPEPEPSAPRSGSVRSAGSAERPGDRFNRQATWPDILEPYGWQAVHRRGATVYWRRPGKTLGVSATSGRNEADNLYVFTTSTEFDAGKPYSKFAAHALLEHSGDYRAAANALAERYGDQAPASSEMPSNTSDFLGAAETSELTPGATWNEVDLSDVVSGLLSGSITRLTPTIGLREGGGALFYLGKINGLAGASGSGKSWTLLACCLEQIAAGQHVVYIDFEDDEVGIVGRLLDLGADSDAVLARFHYIQPDESYSVFARESLLGRLADLKPTLVVIDSTGESMAIDGKKPNDDDDTARWFKSLPGPIARLGPAVTVLDHVIKADDGGLWPIGSQRKRAAISGAQYMQVVTKPFAKGHAGAAKLVCAKDRHGTYRPGEKVADLLVEPDGDGLTVTVTAPPVVAVKDLGTFRPTALMERVSRYLEGLVEPASRSAVTERVSGKRTALLDALDVLKAEGYVTATIGARKAEMCSSLKPYRQDRDPASDNFIRVGERVDP